MKFNPSTSLALAAVLAVIFGLSLFGERLGLAPEALSAIKVAASSLGAILLAALRQILSKDSDNNGVPDALEGQ